MAYMVKAGLAEFAISEDSDLVAYGCPKILMKLDFWGKAQAWSLEEFKKMTFDYSFWSHDGFLTKEDGYCYPDGPASPYHDQAHVYKVIGVDVLNSAWEGFHVCLFAYGQTGSGKSYSMTGYGANRGVIPLACTEIFERIAANTDPELTY